MENSDLDTIQNVKKPGQQTVSVTMETVVVMNNCSVALTLHSVNNQVSVVTTETVVVMNICDL